MGTMQIINGPIIPAGESLSDAVDCSAGRVVRITTPAQWDSDAPISFEVSTDGNGFNPLYADDGHLIQIPCGPARAILIAQENWWPGLFIKIRSGTPTGPMKQAQQREFAIALYVEDVVTP